MIEQLIDGSLWALTVVPFLMGNMGGGGGGSPQPPQLNPQQSAQLYEKQLQLQQKYLPSMTATAGTASRAQDAEAVRFGLGMLTNPSATIYAPQISSLNKRNQDIQRQIGQLNQQLKSGRISTTVGNVTTTKPLTAAQRRSMQNQVGSLQKQVASNQKSIATYRDPSYTDRQLRAALPQEFAARDRLLGQISAAQQSSPEYQRMQEALARGVQAQQADMERVQAQQTEESALGRSLMDEARSKIAQGGRLSPEAERNAIQAARAGVAARGMATGNAALGAELLNRDRFSRQREFENLGFAQTVEANDLARRTGNTQLRQQAGMQNAQAFNQLSQFNTLQRADTDRYNIGLLGQASQMSDAERARQLGLGQDAYNFGLSTNPRMMLAGLGSPYANMTGNAMQMVSGAQGLSPMYSGGQFSGQGGFNMAGAGMGALSGAASGAMIGSVVPGIGTVAGAIGGGLIGGLGGGLSDKREKTDIKKIDGPTNVIGIPAYEYRYKGEKKKRKGVMAQDVQKVLPEAVAEIDYKGKKRLAIKPAVIGAALAEQLAADTKPVALAS
jgi:hypothetical protein